jgi:hypothetical protein
MQSAVHLTCHTLLNLTHAFQHDERYRLQCLYGAEERLVMKQSVCGPPVQLWV